MHIKNYAKALLAVFATLCLGSCSPSDGGHKLTKENLGIVPMPNTVNIHPGSFTLDKGAGIWVSDPALNPEKTLLSAWIGAGEATEGESAIRLVLDKQMAGDEAYKLSITEEGITISGAAASGVFYGMQSLRQLLPAAMEQGAFAGAELPHMEIVDAPRFAWRGMHLDVSRHFMPLEFVKKYIDYLAMHKLNTFHWHLVDGIGWRMEIKKYPRLTEWGAWRVVKGERPWLDFEVSKPGDTRPREGGFYTQDEMREVVAYAASKHITVIPEVELPGHSEVVFQCFEHMKCQHKGKALDNIGVYCAGNPESYTFLENIIDEMLEIFPSEYIHIGGDEVNKANWKKCSACQKLMKKEGLHDEEELQSHFVNHFDSYLKARGRKLIGWHEIVEGDLSETATLSFWAHERETQQYLDMGHPMVLSPGSHYYFDHYQSLSVHEPKAFGGFSNLSKVYQYEPIPETATAEQQKLIMGVQANIWTEYMKTPEHVEYMAFPRLAGVAETAWTQRENKSWEAFQQRLPKLLKHYDALNINYARSAWLPQIHAGLDTLSNKAVVKLETELTADIRYTLDGTAPTAQSALYIEPIYPEASCSIKARAFDGDAAQSPVEVLDFQIHKAKGAAVEMISAPYSGYSAQGGATLVDLELGGDKWGNGKWLGILDKDLELKLDLGAPTAIHAVTLRCIEETGAGIYFPADLQVLASNDGANYEEIGLWQRTVPTTIEKTPEVGNMLLKAECDGASYRYLQVKATSISTLHKHGGVFIFTDELMVE